MAIFYSVRVVPETMPPLVEGGRLELLAAIQMTEHRKLEAEKVAQECADRYGYCFDVYQVTERQHGRFKPKGPIDGNS